MTAGEENLERQRARLARHGAALACLHGWGLGSATIDRYGLGLKAPYRPRGDAPPVEHALSFPVTGADGRRLSRFAFLNLEGVTVSPPHPAGWGVGSPLSYWSEVASPALPLVVAPDVPTTWLLSQALDGDALVAVVLTRTHGGELPLEWRDERFWSGWPLIAVMSGGDAGDAFGNEVARIAGREVLRLDPPTGLDWRAALREGISANDLRARLAAAGAWQAADAAPAVADEMGDFAFQPLNIANAFVDGRMFYPFLVEERLRQSATGRAGGRASGRPSSQATPSACCAPTGRYCGSARCRHRAAPRRPPASAPSATEHVWWGSPPCRGTRAGATGRSCIT